MSEEKKHIATKKAKNIFEDIIAKIRIAVKKEEQIVYDHTTGIQKCFLKGKLVWTKKVRNI